MCLLGYLSASAFSEFRKHGQNLWELELGGNSFETAANYTKSGGSFDSLPGSNSYKLINMDFGARWGLTKIWSLYGETRLGVAESKDPTQTRSNSQFNRIAIGSDLLLSDGAFKVIPDVQIIIPLAKVDKTADTVQTGESATELLGRVISRFDLWRLRNQINLGLNYRDEGRSSLMTYGAGSEFDFGGWFLGGELVGYVTVMEDQNTADPTLRETSSFRVNGQSAVFNSVNPSLLSTNLWYKFESKRNVFQVGYGMTLTGTNTANGQQIFANWTYRFQSAGSQHENREKPDIQRFQEETNDEIDQNLFKAPKPAPPPPPPQPDARKQLQKELDQTEMEIVLKAKKKKARHR